MAEKPRAPKILHKYHCSGPTKFIGTLKKEDRRHSHAVVLWIEDGKVYMEDPKPDTDYTFEDLCAIEILYPVIKETAPGGES